MFDILMGLSVFVTIIRTVYLFSVADSYFRDMALIGGLLAVAALSLEIFYFYPMIKNYTDKDTHVIESTNQIKEKSEKTKCEL